MNLDFLILLIGFGMVAIAGNQIAKFFQKIKFPLVTGLIVTGIVAGTSLLNFIPSETLPKLNFLNSIALAIIAFSAGAELYIKDLRSRISSIKWMTIGQLFVTLIMSAWVIYFFASKIPFMNSLDDKTKIVVSVLFGVIFVARSPSSIIAVINELRAKRSFYQNSNRCYCCKRRISNNFIFYLFYSFQVNCKWGSIWNYFFGFFFFRINIIIHFRNIDWKSFEFNSFG